MIIGKKCAAIVLNYNDYANVIKFVHSISAYKLIDQIIVVDNDSTDGSYEKLLDLGSNDNRVSVFNTGKNGGYGFGNNYGIRIAQSQFNCDIAFICNSDITVSEDCMDAIATTILESDDIAIASAIQRNGYTGKVIKETSWDVPKAIDYIKSSLVIMRAVIPAKRDNYSKPVENVGCVPGAFLAVSIERFLSFGGYDENIFLFCEESVIGARAKEHGFKTVLLTNHYYDHYHSTSINKNIPKKMNQFKMILKSRMYYLKRYRKLNRWQATVVKLIFGFAVAEWHIKLLLLPER